MAGLWRRRLDLAMSWAKLDDGIYKHPKLLSCSVPARWLFIAAIAFSRAEELDSYLSPGHLSFLLGSQGVKRSAVNELLAAGLFEPGPDKGGVVIHDYEEYNPPTSKERMVRQRMSWKASGISERGLAALRQEVYERDGYRCRYCGKEPERDLLVADHVIPVPHGETTLRNLVTCCRSCNRRKDGRTPEEAGMSLLPLESHDMSHDTGNDTVTTEVTDEVTPRTRAGGNPGTRNPLPVTPETLLEASPRLEASLHAPPLSPSPDSEVPEPSSPLTVNGVQIKKVSDNDALAPTEEELALVAKYLEATGNQPSGVDVLKAREFLAELSALGTDGIIDSVRRHVARRREEGKRWPATLGKFWPILRADHDYRRDHNGRRSGGHIDHGPQPMGDSL